MYSKENLARGWDAIQYMLQLQFHEIQIYFRRSCTAMKHRYRGNLFYSNLEYMVSRVGLNCVVSIIRSVVVWPGHHIYRLPCACMNHIWLVEVNIHWKRLCFEVGWWCEGRWRSFFFFLAEWNRIKKRPEKVNWKMKLHINEQMCRIAFSETNMFTSPNKSYKQRSPKREWVLHQMIVQLFALQLCGSMLTHNF